MRLRGKTVLLSNGFIGKIQTNYKYPYNSNVRKIHFISADDNWNDSKGFSFGPNFMFYVQSAEPTNRYDPYIECILEK